MYISSLELYLRQASIGMNRYWYWIVKGLAVSENNNNNNNKLLKTNLKMMPDAQRFHVPCSPLKTVFIYAMQ